MTIIEQIKAEIERLKVNYLNRSYTFVPTAMQQLLDFIDNLESEKPSEGLEEEMDKFFETMPVLEHENIFEDTFKNIARHFAQWGAKQNKEKQQ